MTPSGSSVHYVSSSGTSQDHLGLPRADEGYRQPHRQHEARPTGIDFAALAPTCKICGQQSGTVNTRTGMCASCDPIVATKKLPKKEKQGRHTPRPSAPRHDRPAAPRVVPATPAPSPQTPAVTEETRPRVAVGTPLPQAAPEPVPEPVVELEHPQPHAGEHQAAPEAAALAEPPVVSPHDPGRRLVLELDDVRTTLVRAHGHPDATIAKLRDLALQAVDILRTRLDELHPPQPVLQVAPDPEPPRPRRVVGRDPEAPRRSRATPAWAKQVDEEAIVREYVEDLDSSPMIATRHGILPKRVRDILDRHDVHRRDDRATRSGSQPKPIEEYDDDQVATIVDRYIAGESSVQIGDSLEVSHRVVLTILKKANVDLRPPASIARATTIDDATADEIARRYAAGDSSNDLAAEYRIRAERCRQIVVDHGITIRKRGDGSHHLQQLIQDLGVTPKDVKVWAVEQGLLETVTRGSVAARITAAYAAAHQPPVPEQPDVVEQEAIA